MKFNPIYTTAKSKWYLCFCCLWGKCCSVPDETATPEVMEEYNFLNASTADFFHLTDWEKLYPLCRKFRLVKEAEEEAGIIYTAYLNGTLQDLIAGQTIPSIQQVLKFWRWLNSDRTLSLLHHEF